MNARRREWGWMVFVLAAVIILPLCSCSFIAGLQTAACGAVLSAILWRAFVLPAENAEDLAFRRKRFEENRKSGWS